MVPNQRALLRERCLVALIESASVGDTSKDRRNELRIIAQAKSIKQLILLAEIDIEAGVEGFSVFVQNRRIRVVRRQSIAVWTGEEIQQGDGIGVQSSRRQDIEI